MILKTKNFPYKRLNDLLEQYNASFTSTTLIDNKYSSYAFKLNNERVHIIKLENNKYMMAILEYVKVKENFYMFVPDQIIKADLNFTQLKNELINILM